MPGRHPRKTCYRRSLRKVARPAIPYSRLALIARKSAAVRSTAGRKTAFAWLRGDLSRSGYSMTIIAIASLAAAVLGGSGDGSRIVVVPVAAAPYEAQKLPAEWQAPLGPKPAIVISRSPACFPVRVL